MIKFSKKLIIYIVISIFAILLLPIVINLLMTMKVPEWLSFLSPNGVSTNNEWIGFYGGFLGSLLGGLLTLGGVMLTIKEQRIKSIIENYPLKMRNLDKINDKVGEYFLTIRSYDDNKKSLLAVREVRKLQEEKSEFMELASEINGEFYYKVKYLFQVLDDWEAGYSGELEIRVPEVSDDIAKWKMQFEEMYENFSKSLEALIKEREPRYFQ